MPGLVMIICCIGIGGWLGLETRTCLEGPCGPVEGVMLVTG